jgi:TPR repeat protein
MTRLRLSVALVVLVLLVSGVAWAQTPTAPKESAEVAAIRVKANAGDAQAQSTLGMSYLDRGVPQDDAQAASWFRKAAEQGLADAQNILGAMSERGWGVPQDFVEAHKWLNLAASRASAAYQRTYAETRDRVAKKMTRAQIADAKKLAREWLAAFDARQE